LDFESYINSVPPIKPIFLPFLHQEEKLVKNGIYLYFENFLPTKHFSKLSIEFFVLSHRLSRSVQSPCNHLIEEYTQLFYMIYKRDFPSIQCNMSLKEKISKLKLHNDWRFTAMQFCLGVKALETHDQRFCFQLNPCGKNPYVISSVTRWRVCLLWICLAFHQVYVSHILHVTENIFFCTIHKSSLSTGFAKQIMLI
jgi:hypothetical protein